MQAADGMFARAVHLNGILISHCRHLGVFDGQILDPGLEDCPFAFWLAQGQLHSYSTLNFPELSLHVNHLT